MKVLDADDSLGCMTQIIADLVGSDGNIIAIDNKNQINAARDKMPNNLNIEYKVNDIYE